MIKLLTIIGARPQIIKASALSRAIKTSFSKDITEVIVHTGQHYDENMSEVFFSELNIPKPKYNLGIGSGSHGEQTGKMIIKLEDILTKEKPDAMIIYGDTNSTLAGAIAASKMQIKVIHIEAGLRSFDKTMPEEINRILSDHVSTLLFTPTQAGYNNLIHEGFSSTLSDKPTFNCPNIYHCGDIMYDNTLFFYKYAINKIDSIEKFGKDFILCTIHRNTNTDDKERLTNIFSALEDMSKDNKIILPLHPRTRKMMPLMLGEDFVKRLEKNTNIKIIEPVSFLDMIYLEAKSKLIVTDSGGVQKEAYYLKKPSIILRKQTEWIEIVNTGNAIVADTDKDKIISSAKAFLKETPNDFPQIFGDGKAAEFICDKIIKTIK